MILNIFYCFDKVNRHVFLLIYQNIRKMLHYYIIIIAINWFEVFTEIKIYILLAFVILPCRLEGGYKDFGGTLPLFSL
jgi:hypothetical protein